MNTGTVSVRYAKALLQYAVEQGDAAQGIAFIECLAFNLGDKAVDGHTVEDGAAFEGTTAK